MLEYDDMENEFITGMQGNRILQVGQITRVMKIKYAARSVQIQATISIWRRVYYLWMNTHIE